MHALGMALVIVSGSSIFLAFKSKRYGVVQLRPPSLGLGATV